MNPNSDQLETFREIIEKHGRGIMQEAVEQVLDSKYKGGVVSSASKYHARFLRNVLPVFPALTSLSCQAVGGTAEKTMGVGAALSLFVEAANIHDDIIDRTESKHSRKTAFGKFGGDVALLAGDVLLVQGALLLCKECEPLPDEQKKVILDLTFEALIEIGKSAAKETEMRRRFDTAPEEYLEVIRLRASVPEAHCRIGAILGGGTEDMICTLGGYGRTYGIVGTIVDEFMDLRDYHKFNNRLKNECVPLPVLSAFENSKIRKEIAPILDNLDVGKKDMDKIFKMVMDSDEAHKLQKYTFSLADSTLNQLKALKANTAIRDLSLLLDIVKGLLCSMG